jgi:hypothetical protein
MKYLLVIPVATLLAACSSKNDVAMNTDYQWSKSHAEQKRLEAIAEIAKQGEGGVVAAALLMQQNGQYNAAPPRTGGDRAVDLAKTIMPALGNTLVGVGQIAATVYAADIQKDIAVNSSNNNKDIAINNSDNNATVYMHTNDTMAGIAEVTIVNPEVVETTTTTTNTTTSTTTTNN